MPRIATLPLSLPPLTLSLGSRARQLAVAGLALATVACGDDGPVQPADTEGTESGSTGSATGALDSTGGSTLDPDSTVGSSTDQPGTTGETMTLFERTVTALGGAERLEGLETIEVVTSGSRYIPDEGPVPGGASVLAHEYTTTARIDLLEGNARLDHDRVHRYFLPFDGAPLSFGEVLTGELGFFEGSDSIFALAAPMQPPPSPMPSDRWAAVWRQQRLLHPQLLLRELLDTPELAVETGAVDFDGRPHERLELPDPVHPITLWIDAETARITRMTTVENSQLRRDSELELRYESWSDTDGVMFPAEVQLWLHGNLMLEETRDAIALDGELRGSFELPEGVEPTYDEAAADRGRRSHQYHHMGSAWGLPTDGIDTTLVNGSDPDVEVSAGVYYLRGNLYNTMVVEQDEGLVIFEAPLHPQFCGAVLDWIEAEYGGAAPPITHVVLSHHHQDHTACARTYVERGASVVVGESAAGLWEQVLGAPSTIVPDALAASPLDDPAARIITVGTDPSAPLEINPDSVLNPITIYPLANEHSEDMVMTYLPDTSLLFVTDLCNPQGPGMPCSSLDPSGPSATYCAAEAAGIAGGVALVAGGHGGPPATGADFLTSAPPMGCGG